MRVVIAGGTGWLGSRLTDSLVADGHEVVVLSRTLASVGPGPVHYRQWNSAAVGDWISALDGADAVVNLAGEPIAAGRWTPRRKVELVASRVVSTRVLVEAIAQVQHRPRTLINGSAVGYYGPRGDEELTEESGPGNDFLARLAVRWEAAALAALKLGVRVVLARTGIVLGSEGALPRLATPIRYFLGGPLGSGRQWVSWVHISDVVGLFRFALEDSDMQGPMNVTSPHPARNSELVRAIGAALGRPTALPVPAPALRLLLGEMAESLLTGQRVLPARALAHGYAFQEPDLRRAVARTLRTEPEYGATYRPAS